MNFTLLSAICHQLPSVTCCQWNSYSVKLYYTNCNHSKALSAVCMHESYN